MLVEDVFDIVGSVCVMQSGPFDGFGEGIRSILIIESQKHFDRLIGINEVFEIFFGHLPQTD